MRFSIKHVYLALGLIGAGGLAAQTAVIPTAGVMSVTNYIPVILIGVVIAVGFQFLLTSLSVAIGVTAIPNMKETYAHARFGGNDSDGNDKDWNETNDSTNVGVVVSSALGIWNVVTAAASLFGATALALTLTETPDYDSTIAITLGLAIWAVFYLLMFYLEGRMVGTAIGGLISTAVSGLRAGGDALKNIFTPSPSSQVQNVADNTIEKLRQEMTATFDTDGITQAIDNFTKKVGKKIDKNMPEVPSYDKIKADLEDIVKSGSNNSNPAKWTAIQSAIQSAIDNSDEGQDDQDAGGQDKIQQLKDLLAKAKSATNQGAGAGADKGKKQSKNGENDNDGSLVNKVTAYIDQATPDSFDSGELIDSIKKLASDPQGGAQDLLAQARDIDQDTIIQAITANTSLDRDQIENYTKQITDGIQGLRSQAGNSLVAVTDKKDDLLDRLEQSVSGFINSTDDDRLNYGDLKNDFVRIFNNPNESIDIVSNRLKTYDRDTLVSVLTNNKKLSRSDIDGVVAQVEDARTTVMDQLQTVRDKANSSFNQAARRAAIQAEHARKAAIAASWWLFTAIVASGVAAIAGSLTGI